MSPTIYTIGFTKKGAERFFGLLGDADVRLLLDIRARPESQLAGFARAPDLAWFLKRLNGIDYLRVPSLAPSKALLADYRAEKVGWDDYARRYLAEIEPATVETELAGVDLHRTCLLCAEDSADQCHRRLAAEWLKTRTPETGIVHLI